MTQQLKNLINEILDFFKTVETFPNCAYWLDPHDKRLKKMSIQELRKIFAPYNVHVDYCDNTPAPGTNWIIYPDGYEDLGDYLKSKRDI